MVMSQLYASELSGDYLYLPKTVSSPSAVEYTDPSSKAKALDSVTIRNVFDPVDMELDRMEAIQNALNQSNNLPPVQEKEKPIKEASTVKTFSKAKQESAPLPAVPQTPSPNPQNPSAEVKTLFLNEIMASSPTRPGFRMLYGSSVIIQGRNIQRFLAMDDGFINVSKIDHNQIMVKALRYGGTFLNVWDDDGRRTIYVGIVFPPSHNAQDEAVKKKELHERPFRFSYSNDWDTYYYGQKNHDFKRQSYDFLQNAALEGQTPYGYFDTAVGYEDFSGRGDVSYYTVGLGHIPTLEATDVSMRAFDATKSLSPLTMPSTRLRGVFADVTFDHDTLGVSYSYGQKRPYFLTSVFPNTSPDLKSYINALRLTLFPKDLDNQIAINAAQGSGSEHEPYLVKKVYSLEAHKKILNTYLNGEYAQGDDHHASLAGVRWQKGAFNTAFNFRQTGNNYTSISGVPSNQGEIGGIWTTSIDGEYITEQTVFDVYREYLYFNPNDPQAINYDISGHLRMPVSKTLWSDTNMFYNHTPGEISPRRNLGLDQRISRAIDLFGLKNTNVYVGGALQRSRYEFSNNSQYDRYAALSGIQVPLTKEVSIYANYDFSWVHEIDSDRHLTPTVFSTGLYYNKQLTNKLSANFEAFYRKETGAKGTTTYLSGEDSAGASLGFSYNPSNDVNVFFDTRTRKVWPLVDGNLPYNDLDIRLGLRMSFDVLSRGWDPHGDIRGHVYKDKDGSGRYKVGDPGIEGAKVNVGERQVVTDKKGFYSMDVNAKTVVVTPETDTLPSGTVFSTPVSRTVDVKPWANSPVDFGLNSQTGIYGLLFVDKNGNGIPDSADQFVRNIKIVLDKKYTSITDTQGAFYFRNIAEGTHTIRIDINSLPLNMLPLTKLENKINVAEGTTYVFHVPLKTTKQEEK
jgi:hypothetical protein